MSLWMFDATFKTARGHQIAGIDEAGRGPIAGPLVVAGVILNPTPQMEGLNDSKKLSATVRHTLYDQITDECVAYHILIVDESTIDEKNIYQATKAAMNQIAQALKADFTLTDAMPLASFIPHEAIIQGDTLSASIAAASILAKVTRDRIMMAYDKAYPGYGFKTHKGYPTQKHVAALQENGPSPIHRKSFRPVKDMLD